MACVSFAAPANECPGRSTTTEGACQRSRPVGAPAWDSDRPGLSVGPGRDRCKVGRGRRRKPL